MIIEHLDITPQGIRPDLIGRSRRETDAMLGEGQASRQGLLRGEHDIIYPAAHARAAFRNGHTVEISFVPPAPILFRLQRLFDHPQLWRDIAAMDLSARESLGFLVLPTLGITLTGFHDDDVSQLALTVFEHGRWDDRDV